MILYLAIALIFLITWVINTYNFAGLIAFLTFLVLLFVAIKLPRIPSSEGRRWSMIISILMILFLIVYLLLSVLSSR
ncbi:Na(+)/H(+) antiporter subunit E [Vulcanisaeta distributa DSM 14429]|uniref:Na(+)/H(+) antiporter subunit E n=1 Tax=Vulcanisaeta distributa (strain DSM 14429 / JCM 11212 / NBRC 100878 / IC-017) TaxID=572478 RepID=E1QRD7_VULDI|nr:Na(+)/H(+) antiporter subunit E [Vulcanisaeta distributa DSM 14429]